MASRPSPPKPYERGRLTAPSPSGPASTAMTPVSAGSSSRPLGSSLTGSYGGRPPMREEFARARSSYDDRPSGGYGSGSSYSGPSSYSSSYSSSLGPRPPPRPYESRFGGGYGSGYGSGYGGGYGSSYGGGYGSDYYPGRYGSSMYGPSYGSPYGGGSSYLNPYSRDPKYLMGEPGFPGAIESHFGWVNDFGRIVDTFARISWLLDMNLETIFGSFNAMLRFFDRIRFMNLADLAPMVQAVVFLAGLGVAGAKLAELIKGKARGADADIALFEEQFANSGRSGGRRRSKHMWAFVLLGLVAAFLGTPLLFRLLGKIFKREAEKKATLEAPPTRLRAMYDYQPEAREDLPLRAGDVVEVLGARSEGWLEARLPGGRTGLVPENYLEPLEPERRPEEPAAEDERPIRAPLAPPRSRVEEITS